MAAAWNFALKLIFPLFLALAFFIPPDGVDALTCFHCKTDNETITNCDKPEKKACAKAGDECYTATLVVDGKLNQLGCGNPKEMMPELPMESKKWKTKRSYCKTEICNGGANAGATGYIQGRSPGHILVISFVLIVVITSYLNDK